MLPIKERYYCKINHEDRYENDQINCRRGDSLHNKKNKGCKRAGQTVRDNALKNEVKKVKDDRLFKHAGEDKAVPNKWGVGKK